MVSNSLTPPTTQNREAVEKISPCIFRNIPLEVYVTFSHADLYPDFSDGWGGGWGSPLFWQTDLENKEALRR